MANANPHVAEFISLFNQTARYHHRYEVFRDFVQMKSTLLGYLCWFDESGNDMM
ncbi:Uncharacterised protein [Serratia fonticola]|uniref:hypothetical protein n=1 Tax=Serratia fonticola TaxID=47917 RepID=UPI002182F3F5|nr:hypothetical protein [Serratia fonticola]CAI2039967.1 Uncharacterised protein [Serratia fonticola]